jgi:hypothetical protein
MDTYSTNWKNQLNSNNRIFVSIASLNEEDLLNTVKNIYEKADNPDGVRIGICNQKTIGSFEDFSNFKNVKTINISHPLIRGIGIARCESLWLWGGEKYILQVDAHSRFVESWDSKLISWYKKLECINKNIIISQRPSAFTKNKNGVISYDTNLPSVEKLREFQIIDAIEKFTNTKFSNEYRTSISSKIEHNFISEDFIEHYLVAGGFIFSTWKFFTEVMPDPRIQFFGEEHTIPMRAFSRGYSIYAINDIIIHTLEKTDEYLDSDIARDVWHNIFNADIACTTYLHFIDYYKNILTAGELGYYGATDMETYNEYVDKLGFDYRNISGIEFYD